MKVELIDYTKDCEKLVADAARTCYQSESKSEKVNRNLIKMLIESGHTSVLEHIKFTFRIKGVSRVLTHQLVRHRIASYSQKSQRYVREGDYNYVIPTRIAESDEAKKIYNIEMWRSKKAYDKLVKMLMEEGYTEKEAIEDARYVLPGATCSEIVVTKNARALLNFFELRCCDRSQHEIRILAQHMLSLCREKAPTIFKRAGARCLKGKCDEHLKCKG